MSTSHNTDNKINRFVTVFAIPACSLPALPTLPTGRQAAGRRHAGLHRDPSLRSGLLAKVPGQVPGVRVG